MPQSNLLFPRMNNARPAGSHCSFLGIIFCFRPFFFTHHLYPENSVLSMDEHNTRTYTLITSSDALTNHHIKNNTKHRVSSNKYHSATANEINKTFPKTFKRGVNY